MENIHFTDKEKRIFLAAMGHEKKLCKGLDTNDGDETVALVPIVESIVNKVRKSMLWEEDREAKPTYQVKTYIDGHYKIVTVHADGSDDAIIQFKKILTSIGWKNKEYRILNVVLAS